MIGTIKKVVLVEVTSFKKLSENTRNLIVSFAFQGAAYPFVSTFVNAFIFRNEGDFISVILYNLFRFVGLPVAFFLNGLALKKLKVGTLYLVGAMLLGLSSILVVLFSKIVPIYYFYGLIFGLGEGFYWANRNYLTFKQTESSNRNYFLGMNFTLDTIISIVIPFLVGWFIVFGRNIGIQSYTISIITAFILLSISGYLVSRRNYPSPQIEKLIIKYPSRTWVSVRLLSLAIGIVEGATFFFVTLLILNKLGHEGILGTIDSFVAVIFALASYYYGRKAKVIHQRPIYILSVLIGFFASFLLISDIKTIPAIIFISSYSLSIMFMWLTSEPMVMDIMDKIIKKDTHHSYSYVFDREVFLNVGRWVSVLISVILVYKFSEKTFLQFNPLITYALHILVISFIWRNLPKPTSPSLSQK